MIGREEISTLLGVSVKSSPSPIHSPKSPGQNIRTMPQMLRVRWLLKNESPNDDSNLYHCNLDTHQSQIQYVITLI